jgi:hypothetical protein
VSTLIAPLPPLIRCSRVLRVVESNDALDGARQVGDSEADEWIKPPSLNIKAFEMNARPALLRPRYMAYVARREAVRMWSQRSRTEGKRILTVFDPSLISFRGHHWEFAQIIKEGCGSKFDVKFYAHFRARTKIIMSLPAQPICHDDVYAPLGNFDDIYRTKTEATISALNMIGRRNVGPDAFLIMHTVTLYELGALAQWFSALPRSERPKLCIQFQFPLEFRLQADATVRKRAVGLARAAASTLMATGRVRVASNSALLADHISKQLEQHCAVLPLPIRWPDLNQPMSPDPGVVFGFFGGLRAEKGASIIAQAIPVFAAQHPDTRFLVHAPIAESDKAAIGALKAVPQVEMIHNNFDRKVDYFKQFLRASCILLPYDPVEYAYRTSGIFIEAIGLGRLIITTEGSWPYAESRRYGGTAFYMNKYTAADLLACLAEARDRLISQPFEPKINREVMMENSAEAFCSAMVQLVTG